MFLVKHRWLQANPQHVLRVAGAPRALALNMRHDVATPWRWARAVVRQLPPGSALILSNITLYWLTGTIGSSMRMYRANSGSAPAGSC